jgi:hypothetical protein
MYIKLENDIDHNHIMYIKRIQEYKSTRVQEYKNTQTN